LEAFPAIMRGWQLPVAEDDAPSGQVVRGKLDHHPVTRHDPNVVGAHLTRYMAQYFVPILKLYGKESIRQSFEHRTIHGNDIIPAAAWRYRSGACRAGWAALMLLLPVVAWFLHALCKSLLSVMV
jgi:hypothetical protein